MIDKVQRLKRGEICKEDDENDDDNGSTTGVDD